MTVICWLVALALVWIGVLVCIGICDSLKEKSDGSDEHQD